MKLITKIQPELQCVCSCDVRYLQGLSMSITFKKIDMTKDFETFLNIRLLAHQELNYMPNLDAAYMRQFTERTLDAFGDQAFWHLYNEDILIGQLEIGVKRDNGYVFLFYIYPEYRGVGYFKIMHQKMLEIMNSKNFTEVRLATPPTTTHAINIYQHYGWQNYGPDLDKPEMLGFTLLLK